MPIYKMEESKLTESIVCDLLKEAIKMESDVEYKYVNIKQDIPIY